MLSQPQRKALLRCLIDKVVVHRVPRDEVQTRIVWKGGATTTFAVPVTVGAFADLQGAAAMEQQILTLFAAGHTDEAIAAQLTQQGYRSPQRPQVLPSTVKTIRLKHGLMQQRHQSHPRHVAGSLTVPQLARRLGVSPIGSTTGSPMARSRSTKIRPRGSTYFRISPRRWSASNSCRPACVRRSVCEHPRQTSTLKNKEEYTKIFWIHMTRIEQKKPIRSRIKRRYV